MSPNSDIAIIGSKDNVIADALRAATSAVEPIKLGEGVSTAPADIDPSVIQPAEKKEDPATAAQLAAVQEYAKGLIHSMTRHNTPFDGRKRNRKVAKRKASRKANKKRKLYIRYGV